MCEMNIPQPAQQTEGCKINREKMTRKKLIRGFMDQLAKANTNVILHFNLIVPNDKTFKGVK